MHGHWRFFRTFLSNVAMTIVKTDLALAAHWVETLVPEPRRHLLDDIRAEHDLTRAELLTVTGQDELLAANPVLETTLRVRDAYLAPLHLLQVALMERWRADRDAGRGPTPSSPAPSCSRSTASPPACATRVSPAARRRGPTRP